MSHRGAGRQFRHFVEISCRSLKRGAFSSHNQRGGAICAAIYRCTLAGVMDQGPLRKWPTPPGNGRMSTSPSPIIPKALKIAGGIDERALKRQGSGNREGKCGTFTLAHARDCSSLDRNEFEPTRRGRHVAGFAPIFRSCSRLVPFGFTYGRMIKPSVISYHCAIHTFTSSAIHAVVFTIFGSV